MDYCHYSIEVISNFQTSVSVLKVTTTFPNSDGEEVKRHVTQRLSLSPAVWSRASDQITQRSEISESNWQNESQKKLIYTRLYMTLHHSAH